MARDLPDLVLPGEPRLLAGGFRFTEGPVWHPDGYLLFSDIPADTIYRLVPEGAAEPHVRPSRQSNGLTFDRQGRLLACEHAGRQVSRQAHGGAMETVVDSYDGKRLNSPNDLVVHSSGAIYFTDPPYGIDPDPGEQGFNGVYRVDPQGVLSLLIADFDRPNGLAFSPDESTLYVDDTRRRHVRAFDVGPDGSLSNDRVFVDMDVEAPGNPDGMKVDVEGNVYVTGGGGLWVVEPSGRRVGIVAFPELPANVAFGGPDNRTIYVTARTSVYRVQGRVAGIKAHTGVGD